MALCSLSGFVAVEQGLAPHPEILLSVGFRGIVAMIADAFALVSFCAAVIRAGQLVLIVYEGTALRFLLLGWRIGRDRVVRWA